MTYHEKCLRTWEVVERFLATFLVAFLIALLLAAFYFDSDQPVPVESDIFRSVLAGAIIMGITAATIAARLKYTGFTPPQKEMVPMATTGAKVASFLMGGTALWAVVPVTWYTFF